MLDRVEVTDYGKHSSLLQNTNNYGYEKFYSTGPGTTLRNCSSINFNTFSLSLTSRTNKLECFFLASRHGWDWKMMKCKWKDAIGAVQHLGFTRMEWIFKISKMHYLMNEIEIFKFGSNDLEQCLNDISNIIYFNAVFTF